MRFQSTTAVSPSGLVVRPHGLSHTGVNDRLCAQQLVFSTRTDLFAELKLNGAFRGYSCHNRPPPIGIVVQESIHICGI